MNRVHPSILNSYRRQELQKDTERNLTPAVNEIETVDSMQPTPIGEVALRASGLKRLLRNRTNETGDTS